MSKSHSTVRNDSHRSAFTLLEVVLALAILAGAIAVLGELTRGGLHSARRARDLSRATLFCEAKLAELTATAAAGTAVPQSVGPVQLESEIGWVYSIEVADTTSPDLLAVRVTVMPDLPPEKKPVSASAVRWIRASSATTSSSSSTASGSGSSSSSSSSPSTSSTGGTR